MPLPPITSRRARIWSPPLAETEREVKPDAGPWVALGNGRFRSMSTGRMKYDPHQDPTWHADIKRRTDEALEQAGKEPL